MPTDLSAEEDRIRLGGGAKAIDRQHEKNRLTARERISKLLDPDAHWFELGLWAAWGMYAEWGGAPSAGVVTGVGTVSGRQVMVIANDATVKAGAFFPMTCKKVLRAQRIALENRLPLLYLVDSAGVFLPLQDEVFPDEDDFGRIFRNNAVISAAGVPQFAAIMGNCVAGGGYLPVLCDTLLMTEGSGLYLAGPALVKAAIGQVVDSEALGGAKMHGAISGTIDYREPTDDACIERLRRLVEMLPAGRTPSASEGVSDTPSLALGVRPETFEPFTQAEYDVRDLLKLVLDDSPFDEYKADYGKSLVCGFGKLGGTAVGVVANQKQRVKAADGQMQFGGVIYVDSADKAARFVMDCNQLRVPILFVQNVNGFMVGKDSEQNGIIRSGAKLVNAISNSVVPKITLITGGSFGAGNYALCGKAFDPRFILAWPTAKYAVMGGDQAASTLLDVQVQALKRQGKDIDATEMAELRDKVKASYDSQTDIRYAAARLWVDAIIQPEDTRRALLTALTVATRFDEGKPFKTGVLQV
ncbi:methylcrotonoyl- carboxylase : Acetyl-CoA carboxylase, carboxyltransferase component (Subunits alpha and beta) OS=Singulisphaera acidiphila (strain ATCC BAA-1392 / DSM 18658 / VKM B-2454 / MOB10) GN=Sinac_6119 PE=4 SV=1: Carboxyl_trans [Gemmataceae bacterium]|nr:methylcrotonoyl- carboxylase : Acetyl-CoA carboxylase, carboxyltransferase component (Subunits alpha and beta) OS=Singulisphaera acidiphila (strain ATCC BAA-1392 / DSM 18658 / VKM B-2454 / MOB10) GN=Sinac_6119 PE=4 SV=1: Carboxyl_trans [Gemmataceae bacterium]VTT96663.1 methylcrotonoyl- carboxylase : Acetyl-CoA carboxylase, carboxyltransferase component (Subunits alpha and beta) OS=Singulisphaera acidiphila (strain ATCC BAA-1392 / DSM 18658 / VKM B-2454 / MOB10) GN=Sinac_6119 PE=4 SV=1: Carboxyl